LVDARDQYRCVRCGKPFHWSGFSRHHRRLRSHKCRDCMRRRTSSWRVGVAIRDVMGGFTPIRVRP
jgi:DNA-directed RNA polymerase subunit RPC12/RpoP